MQDKQTPLWQPSQSRIDQANLTRYTEQYAPDKVDYSALWNWSVDKPAEFWSTVWDFCGVVGDKGDQALVEHQEMIDAQWFPQARLNYAENCLRPEFDKQEIVFWGEDQVKRTASGSELREQVSQCQQAFVAMGLNTGDRVAAFLPNCPEAIIAMLATASLGAVWCSASPDFGVDGVLDRFGQIEP